jgi:trehalose 6-phosphate phosphatase
MKNVLSPQNAEVLTRFAWSNVLVGLDFDGTLAPIVDRPEAAALRASTRALLTDLTAKYPVVVISGRARADVAARIDGTGVHAVVGNHGLEPGADTERCRRTVESWLPALHVALDPHRGIEIEDKRFSIAIHYRRAPSRRAALADIRAAIAGLDGRRRATGGKLVVNLIPEPAPHKGIALVSLRDQFGADTAVYVGDDVTDEDVFALDDPGRLLGIRVGRLADSHAAWFVESQRAVDRLLGRLVDLRGRPRRRRERAAG